MKFSVVIITPPQYVHSETFREVAETIHYALLELGYSSAIHQVPQFDGSQNIIFGSNLLPRYPMTIPPNAILYNLEQISPGSPWCPPALIELFQKFKVWEYSEANLKHLHTLGVKNVKHVPIGYVPQLTRISHQPKPDIDVLFFGSVNQRRLDVFTELQEKGLAVEVLTSCYGKTRDAFIGRSKVVLNVHYYESKVFEIVRVSYLLANKCFVISETGKKQGEEAYWDQGMVFAPYDQIANSCLTHVANESKRHTIAERGFELISSRRQGDILRPILSTLGHEL